MTGDWIKTYQDKENRELCKKLIDDLLQKARKNCKLATRPSKNTSKKGSVLI